MVYWIVVIQKCTFLLFIIYVLLLLSNWDLTLNELKLYVKICSTQRTNIEKRGQGSLLIYLENILSASLKMMVFIFLVFRVHLMQFSLEELRLGVVVFFSISESFGRKFQNWNVWKTIQCFVRSFQKSFLYLFRFFSFCFSFNWWS